MRVLSLAAPLLLSTSAVHALPRRFDDQRISTWSSAFSSAWETMRDSAFGWYSTNIYDQLEELEDTFRAPDKTVLQWLEEHSE